MPLCHTRAPRGLEVEIQGRKRKALCKLTLYDNCPLWKDREVTTCCLFTHPFEFFLQPCMLLLYCFSQLLSVLGCPAHLSPFI